MNDRLTALDVSFLYLEGESTPMHVGGLAVFDPPPGGFDYERFLLLVEDRISLVPRYRQKIKWVPGHIGYPVWVDDTEFDVGFHVRRSALPRPGSPEQLRELVARLQSRPLDRSRPLWEMNIVEGLAGGGFAIITKTHHAMVDGISAVDLAQVILDPTAQPRDTRPEHWRPRAEPGPVDLVVDAVRDLISRPGAVVDAVRMGVNDARSTTGKLVGTATGLLSAARVAARPAPSLPLNVAIGAQRRFAVARTSLADYKLVRTHVQGTVNDVVLATVAGALRGWLMARGRAVTSGTTVRALVPLSVRTGPASELGNRVSSYLVDLPVGEPNPLVRLTQISYAMAAHKESGQSVGADALIALSGFAPPTLHALGARAANSFTRRLFNLVVSNVPGPQFPLFADGAQLREMFPIVPLASGQAVSIGLTSYDGNVFFGLNADRDAMGDIDTLAALLEESLAELVRAVSAVSAVPRRGKRDRSDVEGADGDGGVRTTAGRVRDGGGTDVGRANVARKSGVREHTGQGRGARRAGGRVSGGRGTGRADVERAVDEPVEGGRAVDVPRGTARADDGRVTALRPRSTSGAGEPGARSQPGRARPRAGAPGTSLGSEPPRDERR